MRASRNHLSEEQAADSYLSLRVNRSPDQFLSIEQILKSTIPAATLLPGLTAVPSPFEA